MKNIYEDETSLKETEENEEMRGKCINQRRKYMSNHRNEKKTS